MNTVNSLIETNLSELCKYMEKKHMHARQALFIH